MIFNRLAAAKLIPQLHIDGIIAPVCGIRLLDGGAAAHGEDAGNGVLNALIDILRGESLVYGNGWMGAFSAPDGRNRFVYQSLDGRCGG